MTSRANAREELPTPTNAIAMFGAVLRGLDAASPTGTNATEDVVADFTGGASLIAGDASNPLPVAIASAQTTGTTLKINVRGRYLVQAYVGAVGAVTVLAAISVDSPAADLNTDPDIIADPTTIAFGRAVGVAAATVPICIAGEVKVSQVMADTAGLGLVRLLLSNGAGAGPAAAALDVANCYIKIERIGDFEAP